MCMSLTAGGRLISVGVDRVGRLPGDDEARRGAGIPQGGGGHAGGHAGRPPGSDRGETILQCPEFKSIRTNSR